MLAQALVPQVARTRRQRLVAPVATIGALGLVTLALHLRDPHSEGTWGECPSAAMGFWCPGCGGLRAVNDLTRGQVGAAASSNLLLVVAIPVAVVLLGRWLVDRWRGVERPDALDVGRPATIAILTTLVAFTVLRNLAVGSWLAP